MTLLGAGIPWKAAAVRQWLHYWLRYAISRFDSDMMSILYGCKIGPKTAKSEKLDDYPHPASELIYCCHDVLYAISHTQICNTQLMGSPTLKICSCYCTCTHPAHSASSLRRSLLLQKPSRSGIIQLLLVNLRIGFSGRVLHVVAREKRLALVLDVVPQQHRLFIGLDAQTTSY